jgi:hypothetical protein
MKIKKNTFSTLVLELFFPSIANCRKLKIQKNTKIDFPYQAEYCKKEEKLTRISVTAILICDCFIYIILYRPLNRTFCYQKMWYFCILVQYLYAPVKMLKRFTANLLRVAYLKKCRKFFFPFL